MASTTTISIGWKIEDAGNGMRRVIMSAEDLRRVMQANVQESERLQHSLINFASFATGIDSFANTLSSMQSIVGDLTGAYDIQAEVETQLEQVMHNTMQAREEDIQSIKDFCSAQQQIGVVGDEVQLAGAQEMATYLEYKSSLKSLIPVMNDMLVQQYGLAASGEAAAQIGSMLGKVMEGQTGALSRYGYKFDEAQEKILKYGTETEKVAVLVDVITASVGGMNQALAQIDAGRMQQVKNTLGDIKEQFGGLLKSSEPFLQIGANAVTATSGVLKLLKGVKVLTTTIIALNTATKLTLVGAIAAVVAGLAAWVMSADDTSDSLDRLKTAEERAAEAAERMADVEQTADDARKAAASSIELNIAKLKNFNGTKAEEKKLVKEMNDTYGETMGYFKSVASWYQALIKNSKAYCDQMVAEAKARKYADRIAELEIERDKIAYDEYGNQRMYSTKGHWQQREVSKSEYDRAKDQGKKTRVGTRQGSGVDWAKTQKVYYVYDQLGSDLEKAQANVNDYNRQINGLKERTQAAITKIEMPVMGESVRPDDGPKPKSGSSSSSHKVKEEASEGSIQHVKDRISDIDKKITFSVDPDEVYRLQREKISLQNRLKELELPIRIAGSKEELEEMWKDIKPISIDVEVNTEGLTKKLKEIPKVLTPAEKLQQTLGGVSDVAGAAGQAFKGMGQAFDIPALDVMGIIAGAIATLCQGFAQASAQSWQLGPFGWAAFSLTGIAQLTSMIAQIKSATAFADGGVVYGPTLGLVGEYAGARSNPEVIAPLNKLRDIIGDTPGKSPVIVGGRIELSGRTLSLLLENQTKIAGLSGKKRY